MVTQSKSMEVGSTPSLMLLAEVASVLPWEQSRADVPYADRKAFADAMTPEYFLELLAALQKAIETTYSDTLHAEWSALVAKALGQSGGTK